MERETAPDFLAIGHATRDLLPAGGWRLGGGVTFAALTAARLGLRAAIVTSGPPDLLAALTAAAPDVALAAIPAPTATTFENIYVDGRRRQYLRGRAAPITQADIPAAWRLARIVLLAPLAQEVDSALASAFPGALVAATPQGWLRQWDADGHVWPSPLGRAESALSALRALILSVEDLLPPPPGVPSTPEFGQPISRPEAESQIAAWARTVPLVAVTAGKEGARLLRGDGPPEAFPAYPARELDPTGAGDVFAAAFLCHLAKTDDPRPAVDFANRVAGLSIEGEGASAIPTLAEFTQRFGAP